MVRFDIALFLSYYTYPLRGVYMKNNNLEIRKYKMAKLILSEMLIGSLSLTGCSSNTKTSNNTSTINHELASMEALPSYIEVTLPKDYVLIPGAVAVNVNNVKLIEAISVINDPSKGYVFNNSNYGSLNIIGDVKSIDVTLNSDNTITYKAEDGYKIYEPYCVKIENGKNTNIKCVSDFNPIREGKKQNFIKSK